MGIERTNPVIGKTLSSLWRNSRLLVIILKFDCSSVVEHIALHGEGPKLASEFMVAVGSSPTSQKV